MPVIWIDVGDGRIIGDGDSALSQMGVVVGDVAGHAVVLVIDMVPVTDGNGTGGSLSLSCALSGYHQANDSRDEDSAA